MSISIVKKFRNENDLTQEELGNILGCSKQNISKMENGISKITDKQIRILSEKYNVDIFHNVSNESIDSKDCIEIEQIGIKPECGSGVMVYDEPDIKPISLSNHLITDILRCSHPENLKSFVASGDSMEKTIFDGDVLLVDIGRKDISNSGVYIFSNQFAEWRCKRLNITSKGTLQIISDNDKYENEEYSKDEIEITIRGMVIKNLSRGL